MDEQLLNEIISRQVEPYIQMIQNLQQRQREKDAEIVVLKYALLEMDRKFQELEKKVKPVAPARTGTGAAGRAATGASQTRGSAAVGKSSTLTTPRGSSRVGAGAAANQSTAQDRQRSKTPAGQRMQNTLNTSVSSKTGGVSARAGNSSVTRGDSKSKTQDLQSQNMRKTTTTSRTTKPEEVKRGPSTARQSQQSLIGSGASRTSSRQGREPSSNATLTRGTIGKGSSNVKSNNNKNDSSFHTNGRQSDIGLNNSHLQESPQYIHAQFGKVQSILYPWEQKPKRNDPTLKPNVDISLSYVPSYTGKGMKDNLFFVDHSNILFNASSIVILMSIETYEQQLFQGHTDEITSLFYQPNKKMVISSQKANEKEPNPFFIIWNIKNQTKIASVTTHQKSINHVAIDQSGKFAISIGVNFDKMSLAVWNIQELIEQQNKNPDAILKGPLPFIEQNLDHINIHTLKIDNSRSDKEQFTILLGTDQGFKSFTINTDTHEINETKTNVGSDENLGNITSIYQENGEIYIGGDNGFLYCMKNGISEENKVQVSNSTVQCIGSVTKNGETLLATLSVDDNKINLFKGNNLVEQVELYDQDVLAKLGTESLKHKPVAVAREVLISGPFNKAQSIAVHPRFKIFATVGTDKYLRFYSYEAIMNKSKNPLINTIELLNEARSCDFSPNGKYLCVGYMNGVFEVFQVYDNEGEYFQVECLKLFDLNRKVAIQCVKFSPDGKYLVISCHKDLVVFNSTNEDFDQVGFLKGNTQTVLFIQYDKTSQYCMTNAVDGQTLVWELSSEGFKKVDPQLVKDLEWQDKSCVFAWDTLGIWTPDLKETDINCVSISHDKKLMVVADNLHRPRLFLYPAHLQKQSSQLLEYGHSSLIKCAKFMHEDTFLVTLGEEDSTIMVWAYKAFGLNTSHSSPLNLQINKDADVNDDLEKLGNLQLRVSGQKSKQEDDENLLA